MSSEGMRVYGCAAVAGLAAVLYLNSINGSFVFDDHEAIESNIDVRSNTPLSQVFSNDFWGMSLSDPESHKSYRPLVILSFRLNMLLHGLWAPGFHLVNILLHSAVCALYYWMLYRLKVDTGMALVTGLLFASHPIHTEAVSNIVGRTELLAGVFYITSFLFYHKSLALSHSAQRRPSSYSLLPLSLSILFSVAAMLCKEQGITVLGVCWVYDVVLACRLDVREMVKSLKLITHWVYSRVSKGRQEKRHSNVLPHWLTLLAQRTLILTLCGAIIVLCRLYINGRGRPLFVESDNPASFSDSFLTRSLTYSYLIVVNAWLLLSPSRLCFDWSMGSVPLVEELSDQRNAATLSLVLAFGVIVLWAGGVFKKTDSHSLFTEEEASSISSKASSSVLCEKTVDHQCDRGLVLFALSLALIPFLPASNLFFPVGFVVAERVLYLPSMGLCLLTAVGWKRIKSCGPNLRLITTFLLLFLAAIFSVKTVVRNADWTNTESLAKAAIPINPGNAKVFMTLGTFYTQLGQRKCELFYKEALRLRPNYTAAWTNLGLVLLNTDRPAQAEQCYLKALSIKADHINANTNMGHLCRLQERWEEARGYYETALKRRPNNAVVRYNLGLVLEKIGGTKNLQKAEGEFGRGVELQPGHWESHAALAGLLATTTAGGWKVQYGYSKGKRLDKAIHHYQLALSLKPDQADLHYGLSVLFAFKGMLQEAKSELLKVITFSPTHPQAHFDLGGIYEKLGDKTAALLEFYITLAQNPSSTLAQQKVEELT